MHYRVQEYTNVAAERSGGIIIHSKFPVLSVLKFPWLPKFAHSSTLGVNTMECANLGHQRNVNIEHMEEEKEYCCN